MLKHEPVDRQFILNQVKEMLGHSAREDTRRGGTVVMIGGDPGEVVVRVNGCTIEKRANHVPSGIWSLFIELSERTPQN